MRTWITHFIDRLRSSFWLIPSVLMAGAILGAVALVHFDDVYGSQLLELAPSLRKVSPDGTQRLLGTVATSVLTLAGVTFSVTIVALTLASSQFGPRLLRNFIRSRANQATLGTLLATHAYCLIVLRSVRLGEEYAFVPHAATLGAFLLTLVSLGVFTYYIHDVITSIQAERVVSEVYGELSASIERFFGNADDHEDEPTPSEQDDRSRRTLRADEIPVKASHSGYVQAINFERLVEKASNEKLRGRLLVKPGDFVVAGMPLLGLTGAGHSAASFEEAFRDCFFLGPVRTAEQDFEYGIRQLVEVALRALSPGVNDPFTAMNCIDRLGAALVKVAQKKMPQSVFRDADEVIRLRSLPESFSGFLAASCNQIRQASSGKPDVSIRLLEMLESVGRQCRNRGQWKSVLEQASMTASVAAAKCATKHDAAAIEERHAAILELESRWEKAGEEDHSPPQREAAVEDRSMSASIE